MTGNLKNATCILYAERSGNDYCATYLRQYTYCLRDSNLSSSEFEIFTMEPHTHKLAISEVESILEFIRLSVYPYCLANLEPLMCLHFFHLCEMGMNIGPSKKQCNQIFSVCDAEELETIQDYGINIYDYLTKCSQTDSPLDIKSCSIIASNITDQIIANCSEGFFFQDMDEGCIPECSVWTPHSKTKALIVDVITIFPLLIGTISGVAVLLLSWIHRQKL